MGQEEDAGTVVGDDKLVSPAKTTKKPPPESAEGIRVRGLVIFSFWAIVIFLGLPIWLWTTSIHRARLPLQEMLDWADGKVPSSHAPFSYTLLIILILGLQTNIPSTDYDRGTVYPGTRSRAFSSYDPACTR